MSAAAAVKSALAAVPSPVYVGVGVGLVALVGVAILGKIVSDKGAGGMGEWVGKAVGDAAGGVVLGLGDSLGIPRTSESECDKAIREGRTWDASFACPAGRFVREGLFGYSGKATPPYAADVYL